MVRWERGGIALQLIGRDQERSEGAERPNEMPRHASR